MDYKKLVLNRLLDKFERSRAYLDPDAVRRRIMLRLCSDEFPEYDIEKPEVRELVNFVVRELDEKGIVGYEWLRFERGNIIEKIWLKFDNIDAAYREAGRKPKSARVDTVLSILREYKRLVSLPWISKFLEDAEAGIEAKRSLNPFLPDDEETAKAVLDALKAINDKGDEEYLERVFSLRCYGDSKFFEKNVSRKIVEIIKKYLVNAGDFADSHLDDEILAMAGIVKAPEQVDFCGGIEGRLEGRHVDFSIFKYGVAINSRTVKSLEFSSLKQVQKVLFIENKANYADYILKKRKEDELVIFHGGFYSPVREIFFKKVYEAGYKTGVEFYHWGDIDIGGFRMFRRLKTNIIPCLKPLLMDRDAFLSKRGYWMAFDEKYGSVLKGMLENTGFSEFHDVIKVMLEEKSRLEQEAFL